MKITKSGRQFILIRVIAVVLFAIIIGVVLLAIANNLVLAEKIKFFYEGGMLEIGSIILIIYLALWELHNQRTSEYRKQLSNQLKLLKSISAELDILSSEKSEIYNDGSTVKGNLNWYIEEINKNPRSLDHTINHINFELYTISLDNTICKKLEVSKLVRTLSYVNDKINQINVRVLKLQNSKETSEVTDILQVSKEAKEIIEKTKSEIQTQVDVLKTELEEL